MGEADHQVAELKVIVAILVVNMVAVLVNTATVAEKEGEKLWCHSQITERLKRQRKKYKKVGDGDGRFRMRIKSSYKSFSNEFHMVK